MASAGLKIYSSPRQTNMIRHASLSHTVTCFVIMMATAVSRQPYERAVCLTSIFLAAAGVKFRP